MIWENLVIALRAILANKMRSILTTLGIIIGVAAVIAVVSIVQGLNFMIAEQLQGVGATYIMVFPERPDPQDVDLVGREIKLTHDDGQEVLAGSPALRYYNPVFFRGEVARRGDSKHTTMLLGVGEYHQEVANHWVEQGRFFSSLDLQRRAPVCLIGSALIEDLDIPDPVLGKDIVVGRGSCTIIGIMEEKGEFLGQDSDDLILIPITTAAELYGATAMEGLRLDFQAESAAVVEQAKDQIAEILRRRHGIPGGKKDDFRVLLQEEILETTSSIFSTITSVVAAVVGIALLVGGIGIMNIMLVSVTERTREIGIRKAVGARRADILIQFLIEAVTLSMLGGLVGLVAGWGLGALGASLIPGDFPPAHVPSWAVALAFGFAGVIGVLFGTYPAAKASALDPIEALRHE